MSQDRSKTVVAFDLYGTLLSTESIAKELATLYGDENATGLAAQWRRYQLEYTWRINSMGTYRPFSELTRAALKHAVAEKKLAMSEEDEGRLMDAYNGLEAFPEIEAAMDVVERDGSVDAYVFSNGTDDMVRASIGTSPGLARMSRALGPGKLVTVEEARCFKPDPRTYAHFAEKVGMSGREDGIWLVSSNPFDALGARAAGWRSAWIDRSGTGWIDGLGGVIGTAPTIVAVGVDEAVEQIVGLSKPRA
ncbi:haloacid dehalogenase [Colletotrichum higginsianum]|uniref:Haloacid dehalogenase n=2 Tax=Colletotrichum higginsianum TaxID=80884 RepID=H1UYD6_COLHI|nr:Haloacid dehalogenase [Colletotrichum higginsianum IMI 349063]OBR16035.1 Haloacid dehalogenase [Colletotrichum higginsianum IMI 349063]TID04321.1 Haloacetate dehalogenase H-2 [Colletotrichum higginsianum]GJC91705.1 haloacid dehalogenase [Colletotrichum higginsianum]CCF32987.1 haloacid dehalogenase [Colletotrichum higginsianum]